MVFGREASSLNEDQVVDTKKSRTGQKTSAENLRFTLIRQAPLSSSGSTWTSS